MKKIIFLTIVIILIAGIFLVSCTEEKTTTTAPSAVSTKTTSVTTPSKAPSTPKYEYGGVFRQIVTMGPINVGDPAVVPGIPTFYGPAGESLYYSDKDGNPIPCLATSWEFDPNGKYVIFHLRKGVKFHDGTDFNAEAVKFCLDRSRTGQAPGIKPVTSVDVIDDYTVKVNWPKFDYSVWDSLGGQRSASWIISPTSIQTHDKDWPLLNIVGTGAFKLVDYKRDVSMTFEKFGGYWQEGLSYLDKMEFSIIANPTTALMNFKGGAADLITGLSVSDANDLKKEAKYNVVATPGMSVFLAFSSKTEGSPFANLKVRQAVCYAVDTKTIAQGIGGGYYLPSNQSFPPWMWANNPDIKGYPYDPEKAKKLLAEAGYSSGFKTKIYLTSGQSQDMQMAVQAYLKAVGIETEVVPLPAPNIAQMMTTSGWDGLMTGQLLTIVGMDPGALMQGMGFVNRGAYYCSVVREDAALALLDQANGEVDLAKRKTLLKEMGRLIIDEYALICPIYYTQQLNALQLNVRDIGIGEFRYSYEKAWFSK